MGYRPKAHDFWRSAITARLETDALPFTGTSTNALSGASDEYTAMKSALYDLARQRNALTPVCALPPELLTHIFALCAVAEPCADIFGVRMGWIKVSHVCFQWRQTALACASLWADIPLPLGIPWAAEMVARSGRMGLTVRNCKSENFTQAQADFIVSMLGRTRVLELHLSDPAALMERLTAPAPELEVLHLHVDLYMQLTPHALPALPALPMDFLAGIAPRLRHMHLHGIARKIPWNSSLLRGLVSLDVAGGRQAQRPTLNTVLEALRNMPALERLTLHKGLPHATSSSSTAVVQLLKMKACHLHGAWLDVIYLLAHLRLPSGVKLRLQLGMGADTSEDHDYKPLLPVLTTYFRATAQEPLPILEFTTSPGDWDGSLNLRAWRTAMRRVEDDDADTVLNCTWERSLRDEQPGRVSLLRYLAAQVPIAHVLELFVNLEPVPMDADVWCALLRRVRRLHKIHAIEQAGITLARALVDTDAPPEAAEESKSGKPRLRKLKELDLRFIEFRTEAGVDEANALDVYREWLTSRDQRGYSIKYLYLMNCRISAEDVAAWKKAAPKMTLAEAHITEDEDEDEDEDEEDHSEEESLVEEQEEEDDTDEEDEEDEGGEEEIEDGWDGEDSDND